MIIENFLNFQSLEIAMYNFKIANKKMQFGSNIITLSFEENVGLCVMIDYKLKNLHLIGIQNLDSL
jgi:hypothetical protein